MNTKEKIKNKIIDKYNSENSKNIKKIDLNNPADSNEDPFFLEFKKEIFNKITRKDQKEILVNDELTEKNIESIENTNIEYKEELINNEDLLKIKDKVLEVLKLFKLEFFKNRINELKKITINTIFETILDEEISSEVRYKVTKFVDDIIEKEVAEYQSKKDYIRKELLNIYLHKILHDVNLFFERNDYEKLLKMTLFQKKTLINYFIETLYKKYLEVDFLNSKLNEENYNFLKSKIKLFIIYRYDKILSGK